MNTAQETATLHSQIFGLLFDEGAEATFVVDRDGRFVSVCPQTEEMLGRSAQSLIGSCVLDFFDPEQRVSPSHVLAHEGLYEDVAFRNIDDYPVYVVLRVKHLEETAQGRLTACVARDTTERRKLERELITKHAALYAAHADLARANRELAEMGGRLAELSQRAAIGEFSAGIAHSMNNPLGALASAIRQIVKRVDKHGSPELVDELARFLSRSTEALSRLEVIVDAVRRAHRAGGSMSPAENVDLAGMVDSALRFFDHRLANIEVIREYEPGVQARVAADNLHQVLCNVIDNAILSMKDEGVLTLRVKHTGTQTEVEIADNGPGIAQEMASKLFEPFVSGRKQGTGLGLSTGQRLARLWGGDLSLKPSPCGATFVLAIPEGS